MKWSKYLAVTAIGGCATVAQGKRATHSFGHIAAVLALILAGTAAPAVAQTTVPAVQTAEKKWSLARGLSLGGSDVSLDIEDAMRAAGLDDVFPGLLGPIGHPYSTVAGLARETDLTYRHSRRFALGVRRTSVGLGETYGYQETFRHLDVKSRVTTFAPIGYFRVNSNLRVGAGPVGASTEVYYRPVPETPRGTQSFKSTVYGGLLTASLEASVARYLALGFTVSRVWIPEVTAGPFTSDTNIDEWIERYGTATLPAMRVNLSHYTVGLSFGIRF